MIRYQQDRARVIHSFDILEAINSHQVVSRNLNPTRAEDTLTPGPKGFPATKVHLVRDPECEAFEGTQYHEFCG